MTGDAETTTTSTTEGSTAPWAQQAEGRTGGGGRSRVLARVLSPVAAVLPWLVMMAGQGLMLKAYESYRIRFEMGWGTLIVGVILMLVAAILWAALAAWSSTGPLVAGAATIGLGLFVATSSGARLIYRLGVEGPASVQSVMYGVLTPVNLIPIGSLLLAAGLGAAGARRLGRRRG